MKKRIRIGELRVGMYVEELETSSLDHKYYAPFLIDTIDQIKAVITCNAISAVIDVTKGINPDATAQSESEIRRNFEQYLLRHYSSQEIAHARILMSKTVPKVKDLLTNAPREGAINVEAALSSVEDIMASTTKNAGALVSLSKLRRRDEETFVHSISVSALLITFARKLSMNEELIRHVGLAGLLHDVGKMAIPTEILRKQEKLTEHEYRIVRLHPVLGSELLKNKATLPETVLDVCLYHHERYDGSGYPSRLSGEQIPFVARLAAICDVYDALTSRRPYKATWSQARAVETMLSTQGHFDPSLLRQFVSKMILSGDLN
ncbi:MULTISPECIES: HD-GYP domain-containing protein [Agrobacterium]|uniref:Nucleotidyltransferase with HDIG domain n=1 Tax=Agrobacterium larrymoorei TaxID=160699 RepID=A0AAJ2BDH3_9HYPH|nr:HD-GYP domain-containing protein [Agrobacterium larrymoorei]MDQ1195384.1 putative nucleotidyltransferase with HDIG domain [Rhizobium sp. SORGH_AS_0787]MDR6100894.1 putative nucleotidyltransferase with HDIG domain [Agrobacterium larrymoorei]